MASSHWQTYQRGKGYKEGTTGIVPWNVQVWYLQELRVLEDENEMIKGPSFILFPYVSVSLSCSCVCLILHLYIYNKSMQSAAFGRLKSSWVDWRGGVKSFLQMPPYWGGGYHSWIEGAMVVKYGTDPYGRRIPSSGFLQDTSQPTVIWLHQRWLKFLLLSSWLVNGNLLPFGI